MNTEFKIAVFPGDGIGIEIMDVCNQVLDVLEEKIGGFRLVRTTYEAGAGLYRDTGIDIADETMRAAGEADAILLGAIGLPDVRMPDGTEVSPHLAIRKKYKLVAALRPVRSFPNVPGPLSDPRAHKLDMVIIRESTEGLFASVGKGTVEGDHTARDTMVITRPVCEQLFDTAFEVARTRKARGLPGRVTCVDKANVFTSMAFFRKIFEERAAAHPDIEVNYRYVDAMALELVRRPWEYDVLVMENIFGDILSDAGAGIVGGLGLAPTAELGKDHGLFQPAHGTAPDIAGRDLANPTAMLLSAAMMLDWLGKRHDVPACQDAAKALEVAVERGYADGAFMPAEFGGKDGTQAVADQVAAYIRKA